MDRRGYLDLAKYFSRLTEYFTYRNISIPCLKDLEREKLISMTGTETPETENLVYIITSPSIATIGFGLLVLNTVISILLVLDYCRIKIRKNGRQTSTRLDIGVGRGGRHESIEYVGEPREDGGADESRNSPPYYSAPHNGDTRTPVNPASNTTDPFITNDTDGNPRDIFESSGQRENQAPNEHEFDNTAPRTAPTNSQSVSLGTFSDSEVSHGGTDGGLRISRALASALNAQFNRRAAQSETENRDSHPYANPTNQ